MTLLLTRSDVGNLLPMDACIEAVEHAFKLHCEGRADPPGILNIHGRDGSFHIKAGILDLGRPDFAAKTNTNFPGTRNASDCRLSRECCSSPRRSGAHRWR
jgi:alanine dehydrogenase